MTIQEQIKDIKGQLRLYMNGVVSASMRKSGLAYKLNFGVELPRLREIANSIESPSVALAEALWMEDIRECKILATLLYPKDKIDEGTLKLWVSQTPNIEIARLLAMNILQHLDFIRPHTFAWIASPEELTAIIGYLTISRLLRQGDSMDERAVDEFTNQAIAAAISGDFQLRDAAMQALKAYMEQGEQNRKKLLALVEPYATSENAKARILYEQVNEEAMYL